MSIPAARDRGRLIHFAADIPHYDRLLLPRHARGLDVWNETSPVPSIRSCGFLAVMRAGTADEPER